jgi:hypothetical protein
MEKDKRAKKEGNKMGTSRQGGKDDGKEKKKGGVWKIW